MESLVMQILDLGRKRDTVNLEKLIFETEKNTLINMIKTKFNSSDFNTILNYILQSCNGNCHDKRSSIVMSVLDEIKKREVFSSQKCSAMVQRICMDLNKFPTDHLVSLCNYCLTLLQTNNSEINSCCIWRDLLPDALRVLSERDSITFNDLNYTGLEFKTDFINNICMINWSPNIIIPVTAMFIDMSLKKEEHEKIVCKLSCYVEKLTSQEIPPFIFQLLKLCKTQHCQIVFLKLQHHFALKIYNNKEYLSFTSSDSRSLDYIGSAEDHDALEAESTVLFHIQNAASIGYNCIKDYLNYLKNCIKSPKSILQPFQLLVLFAISTVQQYEQIVFDIIRSAIVKSYNEQNRTALSYWYRDLCNMTCNPDNVFLQIINSGSKDFLLETIVNFGFALLNVGSGLGRDTIAEKQWMLGTKIIVKIVLNRKHVFVNILKTFCINIITRTSASQYVECLYILSNKLPLLLLENQNSLVEVMESIIQISAITANQLLDAIIPLAKVSPTIRDQFILILRKGLYSRSVENRQVAVNGFVKLITILKLSNMSQLSESSESFSSGYSLYTQISLNRTTQTIATSVLSNEAICWEILGILKRCFIQEADVKATLYEDLYEAVNQNIQLGIPILDTLWYHVFDYYVVDKETIPPFNFKNCAILRDTDSILQEPLGKLIFCITQIIAKVNQLEDEKDSPTVTKYIDILESACERMINCELVHLELDDGLDINDILPESQYKQYILKEVLMIYEALIGYKILAWIDISSVQGHSIYSLFQAYNRFVQFGKNVHKPKKAKKSDKLTHKENGQSDKSKTQNDSSDAEFSKKMDHSKQSSKLFKLPETILSFNIINKGLEALLATSVPWATVTDVNIIKTKPEIHKFFMQAALVSVGRIKNQKVLNIAKRKYYFDSLRSLFRLIYKGVIVSFNDYVQFDCTTAICAMECFYAIILLINNQYKEYINNFLRKDEEASTEKETDLTCLIKPYIEQFKKLLETDEEELSCDPEIKKLPSILINCLSTMCNFIPPKDSLISLEIYDWLKHFIYNRTVPQRAAGMFINLLFEMHLKNKAGLSFLENISGSLKNVLGMSIDDSTEEIEENCPCIDNINANSIILSICSNTKNVLDDVEALVARIKSEFHTLTYAVDSNIDRRKEDLKSKEKGICCHLCFVTNILFNLVSLVSNDIHVSEAIFKCLIHFYSSMSALTKYFIARSKNSVTFQGVWFEKLIKLIGKQLTPQVYCFITYIGESSQSVNDGSQSNKRKEGTIMRNKVLKQTKLIPKLIYDIEQLSKYLIQLSKKTKVDISKYVGAGVVRDFRIKGLAECMEEKGLKDHSSDSDDDPEDEQSIASGTSEKAIDIPPSKKRRH
ncbi:hypothetical protein GWI33_000852 [Rhynchophorus ferrugineus]|uniref:Fanconi anemia group I protein n=1 Tax=Rhynchophorus ferrugineus TaxID=354439 RepID=A0A834IME0_RHYFE|nr:hypothetical protein GWI33_000852 [Rhynchophorus ferrugineus]